MLAAKSLLRAKSSTALLICLTLLTGGLFKISAFAREAFIAAKFGLTSATDAYFGLQQLPLAVATFMFGSFALAFTPLYAEARRRGEVTWLAGLAFYGVLIGAALTLLMLLTAPVLLHLFVPAADNHTFATLAILSLCFVPIIGIGIWAGICTARGQNLWAMSMTGLPYLVMTLVLLGLYAANRLNELSLPLSMSAGFVLLGLYAFARVLQSSEASSSGLASILTTWRLPEFRRFLRQLSASSTENAGFAANQLLLVYFLARAGTGAISANNCAMRIGMLGYGLLAQPLAQLVQARLCSAETNQRQDVFRRWLLIVASATLALALAVFTFGNTVVRLVYMHGKFKGAQLEEVANILPAWIAYFVVMSLNAVVARYLFTSSKGATYVRRMLCAYAAANALRFAIAGRVAAPWIIWCSVAAEACALLLSLRASLAEEREERGCAPQITKGTPQLLGWRA